MGSGSPILKQACYCQLQCERDGISKSSQLPESLESAENGESGENVEGMKQDCVWRCSRLQS